MSKSYYDDNLFKQLLSNHNIFLLICIVLLFIYILRKFINSDIYSLKKLVKLNDTKSKYLLGSRYLTGTGIRCNVKKGIKLIEEAANEGYSNAQYELGKVYMYGRYVEEDHHKAEYWFLKANESGEPFASLTLASLYCLDTSPIHDYKKSLEWFIIAADYGFSRAKFTLGLMYRDGVGTEQNLIESYIWFLLVCQSGDESYEADKNELLNYLSSEDIKEAEIRYRDILISNKKSKHII